MLKILLAPFLLLWQLVLVAVVILSLWIAAAGWVYVSTATPATMDFSERALAAYFLLGANTWIAGALWPVVEYLWSELSRWR